MYNKIDLCFFLHFYDKSSQQCNGGDVLNIPYTKEEVVKNDFLFISYKHEDNEIVSEVISFLVERGVRLWYDADLVIGENWTKIAESLIKHEHCRGVIFFNSEISFTSEPVYLERKYTLEKKEACDEKKIPFFVFPVNIGKTSTVRLLKAVFDSLPDDDKTIERICPLEYVEGISRLFDRRTIYCYADPDDKEGYMTKLLGHIKKALPSVIDTEALSIREIEKNFGTVSTTLSFGIRKGNVTEDLPAYFLASNQRIEHKGRKYIVEDGIAYETAKMSWIPVYCDEERFVLLSRDIVGTRNGGDSLNDWLVGDFAKTTFSEDEWPEVLHVRLLTEEDIARASTPDFLALNTCETHWWLDSRSEGALQKVVKKDGTIYHSGYNFRVKKSGVRPVICLRKEFVVALKQKKF